MIAQDYQIAYASPIVMEVGVRFLSNRRLDADYYKPEFVDNEQRILGCEYDVHHLRQLWTEGKYGTLPSSSDYSDEGVVLIRGGDFQDLGVIPEEHLVRVPQRYWDRNPKARTKAGEVLLLAKGASIDGPNSVALCPARFEKALVNGSIFRIRTKPGVDSGYLAAYMATPPFLKQKRRAISNTGIFYNDLEAIEGFLVPLPPRPVQEYIGAKVRLAERCRLRARELRDEANRCLDDLLGLPPFSEATNHYEAWWVSPGDFDTVRTEPAYYLPRYLEAIEHLKQAGARAFSDGLLVSGKYGASVPAEYQPEGIPFIRGTDLSANRIDLSDLRYLNPEFASNVRTCRVGRDDVLITRSGTVGIAAAISEKEDGFAFGSFMIRLRFRQDVNPFYVAAFLNSPYGRIQTERESSGAVQLNINLEEIGRILMPVPMIQHQRAIASFWQKYNALLDQSAALVKQAKADVEALIEGRLDVDSILAGRVRPPTWEDIEV